MKYIAYKMFFTFKVTVKRLNIQLNFSITFYGYKKKLKNMYVRIVYNPPNGKIVAYDL